MPRTKIRPRLPIIVRKQHATTTSRSNITSRRERLQALLLEMMGLAVACSAKPPAHERKIIERWLAKRP